MGALVPDAEIAYLQSVYPLAGIAPLTGQQEQFIMHYMRGQSIAAAERAAGYAPGRGKQLLGQPSIQAVIEHLREKTFKDIRVDRETLTQMLFEAHAKSANSMEEIAAIRELGKMHDLYEDAKNKGTKIQVNIDKSVTNIKQIERATDEELLKLAGETILLDPADYEVTYDSD